MLSPLIELFIVFRELAAMGLEALGVLLEQRRVSPVRLASFESIE